jgi:SRSO17 transposase
MAGWEERFGAYVTLLGAVLGHADRREPLRAYTTGLLLPGERKSIEPMAALVEPFRVRAAHQSLHHFVAKAAWDDGALLAAVRDYALPALEGHGPVRAWVVDDTGLPKKGKLSVGVARQYCGQLGKQDNCQVAVTLSVVSEVASLPVAYQLYLPEGWAADPARRATAGVPKEVVFRTKPEIALEQIRRAVANGLPRGVVVTDAGYGNDTDFRDGVTALDLPYVAGIQGSTSLWPPGTAPLPAKPWSGRGRPPKLLRRDAEHQPLAAAKLAMVLPPEAWRTVSWREGTAGRLASRFAAVRVRPAHRDTDRAQARAEEWLLVEWPEGEKEPTKYCLSTLPEATGMEELVATAKLRWRIERDFEELKQELGLGHFEGRGWRGFHHHAALCIAAYGFLVAERCRFSPPGWRPRLKLPRQPAGFRPRGAPPYPARAAQPGLHHYPAPASCGRADAPLAAMSMLLAGLQPQRAVEIYDTVVLRPCPRTKVLICLAS